MNLMQIPLADQSVILSNVGKIGYAVVWFIVFGGLAFLAWWFVIRPMTYKIDVDIISRRGDKGNFIYYDKGKFIKKRSGLEEFRLLKKRKAEVSPPSYEQVYNAQRGRGKLYLRELEKNNYFPLSATDNINDNSLFDSGIVDTLQKNLATVIMAKNAITYRPKQGFMEKYGHYLGFALLIVATFVIIYITLGKVGEISQALAQTGERVAVALEKVNTANMGATP